MSIDLHHNAANDTLVGFQQQPDGRGTLTILFTCLGTLSLCVWSATHLDLPKRNESQNGYTLRYLKWSIVGLFGPELLIWVAWRQYLSARVLTQFVKEVAESRESTEPARNWTIVHSFYAGMGGFVFDLNDTEGPPIIPDVPRLHLTPRGAQLLARCGLLPQISKEEIQDKSKSDGSAKLICCIQVSWLVVSTLGRISESLPVTPLEVNTIAHVASALMCILLWWHKPRWVNEPTVLRGKWTRPMAAFMYMSSQVSAPIRSNKDLLRNFGLTTELAGVLYVDGDVGTRRSTQNEPCIEKLPTLDATSSTAVSSTDEQVDNGRMVARSGQPKSHVELTPEQAVYESMREHRWRAACEAIKRYAPVRQRLKFPERNPEEQRYREALQLYPEMPLKIRQQFKGYNQENAASSGLQADGWVCISEELVIDRPRNWPGDDLIRHMQGHLMGMIMWCTSTVYGAIHLAAWNERFPSTVELWFWRASAIYVVFSGSLWSFLNLLGHLFTPIWLYWYDFLAEGKRGKRRILIYILASIGGTLFFVARTYLVVEAFVSLRALPKSAYASPSWILTVPHLG